MLVDCRLRFRPSHRSSMFKSEQSIISIVALSIDSADAARLIGNNADVSEHEMGARQERGVRTRPTPTNTHSSVAPSEYDRSPSSRMPTTLRRRHMR